MTLQAQAVRRAAVLVHRWTGLALATFLLVVAATGAVLPFQTALQRLVAPGRFLSAPPAQSIDWLALRDIAEQRSGGLVDAMPLHIDGGAAPSYRPVARPGDPPLPFDELVLDPRDGHEVARDRYADLRDGPAQVIPFLYRLHQSLALGAMGETLLGVVALAWTMDCLVGLYLSLPAAPAGWWRRWRVAWTPRWPAPSAFRLHMDLHRAGGLWFWAAMLLFAWTGVAFNLPSVYGLVMRALTGYEAPVSAPANAPVPQTPAIGWTAALAAARMRAAEAAASSGFSIIRERELRFLRDGNRYALGLRTDRDRSDDGANTWVTIDANTGAMLKVDLPTGVQAGNTIDYWLGSIHTVSVGGLAARMLVSAVGIAVVVITVTGVLVWARKRRARVVRASPAVIRTVRENTWHSPHVHRPK